MVENSRAPNVCLFCCKPVKDGNSFANDRNSQKAKHFFTLLERMLGNGRIFTGIWSQVKSFGFDNNSAACYTCNSFLETTCELYHKLKKTELLIQSKIDTLQRVMKQANRVPSRMNAANRAFEVGSAEKSFKNFITMRKEFIKLCSQRTSKCYPRVFVQKLDEVKSEVNPTPNTQTDNLVVIIREWIMSLAAVANLLLIPNHFSNVEATGNLPGLQLELIQSEFESNYNHTHEIAPNHQQLDRESLLGCQLVEGIASVTSTHTDANIETTPSSSEEMGVTDNREAVDQNEFTGSGAKLFKQEIVTASVVPQECEIETNIAEESKERLARDSIALSETIAETVQEDVPEKARQVAKAHLIPSHSTNHHLGFESSTSRYQLRTRSVQMSSLSHGDSSDSESTDPESDMSEPGETFGNNDDESSYSSSTSDTDSDAEDKKDIAFDLSKSKLPRNAAGRLKCSQLGCTYQTQYVKDLEQHEELHKPGDFSCFFCKATQESPFSLAIHELEQHSKEKESKKRKWRGKNVLHCPRCSHQTKKHQHYINHFAKHHLKMRIKGNELCSICQAKVVAGEKYQNLHFKTHHDAANSKKIYCCSESSCSAYFNNRKSFHAHMQENHKSSLQCNLCQKTFNSPLVLRLHKERYHNEKQDIKIKIPKVLPHGCSNCEKRFPEKSYLEKHVTLHGTFKCDLCPKTTNYAPELALHELKHRKDFQSEKFPCQRCHFSTNSQRLYTTHHLEAHQDLTDLLYECQICGDKCKNWNTFENHVKFVHGDDDTDSKAKKRCDKCPAYFLLNKQLVTHQQKKHHPSKITSFKCTVDPCKEKFETEEEMENHKQLHGTFKCQFCETEKNFAKDLAAHELEHDSSTKTSIKCPRCLKTFTTKSKFYECHFIDVHLRLTPKSFSCTICLRKFLKKQTVDNHMKSHHDIEHVDDSQIERCDQCPAYFMKRIQLINHKRDKHEGIDRQTNQCLLCGKTFKSRGALLNHRSQYHGSGTNEKEYPFACDIPKCAKRFKTTEEMEYHKLFSVAPFHRRCPNEKPTVEKLTCEKCGKECKGKLALKCHIKIHREDRPTEFKCDQCDKVFKQKGGLQTHQKFHKGPEEWKFMCSVCSRRFALKGNLTAHMRTHSKEKPFVCQVCGEKYGHRHNLRNHVNSKHKDDGVVDLPKKIVKRFYVSRKGKKLGKEFCFMKDRNQQN